MRAVIIGGAPIADAARMRQYFREGDFFIYCDCGLRQIEALGHAPDLIIGDFDSHENPHAAVETIVLPHEKDDTDSVFAVKEALRRGFDEFLLLGAVGARFDHSLGNVQILYMLDTLAKRALLVDDYSEMEVVSSRPAYVADTFPYFSLLNLSGTARGIEVTGAKYELHDAELTVDFPLGVSNEVVPGRTAEIHVGEGRVLLIRDF